MASLEDLSLGQVAGIIAAGIFIGLCTTILAIKTLAHNGCSQYSIQAHMALDTRRPHEHERISHHLDKSRRTHPGLPMAYPTSSRLDSQ